MNTGNFTWLSLIHSHPILSLGSYSRIYLENLIVSWPGSPLCVNAQSLSRVQLFETPWTIAHQAPLSMKFPRQEYWSGLSCPFPGDLPDPGIEPQSFASPALQADSLPLYHLGKPRVLQSLLNTNFIIPELSIFIYQLVFLFVSYQQLVLCDKDYKPREEE